MTATIKTLEGTATIENGVWSSDSPELVKMLNILCNPQDMLDYDPNPDLVAAERAVDMLPGTTIISFTKPEYKSGVIY